MSSLWLLLPQLLLQLLELPLLPTPSACDRLARLFGRAASMTDPQEIEAMCRDYAKQHYPDLFDL